LPECICLPPPQKPQDGEQSEHTVEIPSIPDVDPTSHKSQLLESTSEDIHSSSPSNTEADNGETTIKSDATPDVNPFVNSSIETRFRYEVDYPSNFIPPITSIKIRKLPSKNVKAEVDEPPTTKKDTTSTINPLPKTKQPPNERESSMAQAVRNRQYQQVIQMFQEYTGSNGVDSPNLIQIDDPLITSSVLNCYLAALVHLGQTAEVEQIVTLFDPSLNREPTTETYALLLRSYIQTMDLRKARLLLFEMVTRGIKIDNEIVEIVVRGEGKWAISLESVDSLINLLCSEYVELRDMRIYNLLIAAYLRRDRPDKARAVLDRVANDGLQPDEGTFHALMQYQGRKEGSEGVRVLLNLMTKSGIAPRIKHLNALVITLAKEGDMDLKAATALLETYKLVPDRATCNIVLQELLSQKFDRQTLENHFEQMERLDLRPDTYTFTILLNEYKRKNSNWRRVETVLQHQTALDPKNVSHVTKNVLLHQMLSRFSKSPLKSEVGDKLQLHWDMHTLTTLVAAYSRSYEWSKVVDLYRKLQKRHIKLDRRFYRVLVSALVKGKQYRECMEVAESLLSSDNILDQILGLECKIRISHTIHKHTGSGKERVFNDVDRFLKFTDEKGITISEKHCNLIALAFLYIYQSHLSVEILESRYHGHGRFQDLEETGKLSMSSWTILMRAYARKKLAGAEGLRSCVERAESNSSQLPTKAFRHFLHRLAKNENFQRWRPEYSAFFRQKDMEIARLMASSRTPQTKGRSSLTKGSILKWVNKLTDDDLKSKSRWINFSIRRRRRMYLMEMNADKGY
jgi:pentatricopeptide repeat protein